LRAPIRHLPRSSTFLSLFRRSAPIVNWDGCLRRKATLLFVPLVLAACAGASSSHIPDRTKDAAAAHEARIAFIVLSWQAAGGSRQHRPLRGEASKLREFPVSAAWWGYDRSDGTSAIQEAVDSGAATVVVPFMPEPWIISRPLVIRTGRVEILLEPGAVLLAKEGAFRGGGDCLIQADGAEDFSIVGYGATLRMRKHDYMKSPYETAEWRHAISLSGVTHARIAGLRIESAGGDGIYVGVLRRLGVHVPCEDLALQDLEIHDSYRQGISVISARRLLIENCEITGSSGARPMSGIDFEPNGGDPGFEDCLVRACRISGNAGVGILFVLTKLAANTAPVSIRVQDCQINNLPLAIWLHGLENHVRGTLTFAGNSFQGLKFLRSSSDFSVVFQPSN
jgi:hypothetical protein